MTDKTNAPTSTSPAGLRGVAAATSSISDVNGEKGELIYQGYNIHDLAKHSTFEEVVFLLWNKRLPNDLELSELKRSLSEASEIPKEIIELMKQFPDEAVLRRRAYFRALDLTRGTPTRHIVTDRKA